MNEPTLSPKLVEILRQVQSNIAAEPLQFIMDDWFRAGDWIPNCGTAACLAGHIIAVAQKRKLSEAMFDWRNNRRSAHLIAQDLSGLTAEQAGKLFYVGNWPAQFRLRFLVEPDAAMCSANNARVAVERLEHFIATGGAE